MEKKKNAYFMLKIVDENDLFNWFKKFERGKNKLTEFLMKW